jgi:hypothetical protein
MMIEESPKDSKKTIQVELWLRVENNNKYIRGKKKVRERIEESILCHYGMEKKANGCEYILTIPYSTDEELDSIIYDDILREAESLADLRYCFTEADVRALDGSERSW